MKGTGESKGTWQVLGMGLLAGAAVGGALGILFAPRSGNETRNGIREFAHNVREKVCGCSGESYSGQY